MQPPPLIQKSKPSVVEEVVEQPQPMSSTFDMDNLDKLKVAFGMKTDDSTTFQEQLTNLFKARALDIRIFTVCGLISNFIHQINNIKNLDTRNEIVINSIYWVAVIISCVFIGTSFKLKNHVTPIKYGFIIMTARNTLRIYNFEN